MLLKGETLEQKIANMSKAAWAMNTDLEAAFIRVLGIALDNRVPREEMPKAIIVISDMEIDYCGNKDWTFYDKTADRFRKYGYDIPNIIFWNVNSRNDVFHADASRKGVQLVGGQSVTIFRQLMGCIGKSPIEMMETVINGERYSCITIAEKI